LDIIFSPESLRTKETLPKIFENFGLRILLKYFSNFNNSSIKGYNDYKTGIFHLGGLIQENIVYKLKIEIKSTVYSSSSLLSFSGTKSFEWGRL
jgi:hypothetical protein